MDIDETLKVLVVDDDLLDRMAVRRALRAIDPPILMEEAVDGESALTALTRASFDCVILDYQLPGTDGLTVLKTLRERGIEVPVVMLTGQGDERLAVELIKAGATDYLLKSMLSSEVLAPSIRNAIRIHSAEILAHQAEEARRESEDRFRTMADSAPVLLWMANMAGERLFFNQSWLEFTGKSQQQEMGNGWLAGVYADDLDQLRSIYQMAYDSRQPFEIEYRLKRTDGEYRWILESGMPRFTPDGGFVGYIGSCSDLTERKRWTEGYRFLADASRVLSSSLDSSVILTNLANLAVPYLADWCVIDMAHEENRFNRLIIITADKDKESLAHEQQGDYPVDPNAVYGLPAVTSAGRPVFYSRPTMDDPFLSEQSDLDLLNIFGWSSLTSVPLIVRGRLLGAITFVMADSGRQYSATDLALAEDLGQRAAVAVENAQLYHEAQEAIRMRDVFLSVASHELKTPLTSLSGNAQLLEKRVTREGSLSERDLKTLNVVVYQANRLNKMIESLLDISRLQHGQLSIQRERLYLSDLIGQLVSEIRPTLESHTLEVQGEQNKLPIVGDALRLEQVFQNLIQNAIKYSPKGGAIEISLFSRDTLACVAITDHGIGIPQSALPHLFSRFYRASNASERQIQGIGVGLYVVKEIIGLHNGTIDVLSTEGQGSTFTVKLPLAVT